MKVIYIAGPYRANNSWDVERNIRVAEDLAYRAAELGAVPLCPHSMFRFFDRTQTDLFWLEGTAELLRRCDAILMGPWWSASVGSCKEKEIAEQMGIPVFFASGGLHDVEQWIKK